MAENDGSRVSSSDDDHQSKPRTMISADNALQIVLNVAQRLPPVTVSLYEAIGKVLAHDITAPDPLPPYPASIKDYLLWMRYVIQYIKDQFDHEEE